MAIRVFLADDHTVLREGLQMLIDQQSDMQVIGMAGDGHTAMTQLMTIDPDIVIMDLSMPGTSGVDVIRQLCKTKPDTRIVTLTRHGEPAYVRQSLQAGARAYVLKQAPSHKLLGAIRSVAAGDVYLDTTLTKHVADVFVKAHHQGADIEAADLSEREAEVIRLITRGYGNQEIAAQLGISVKTVETYKARAMDKLGIYNRAALVRYAVQQGWFEQL